MPRGKYVNHKGKNRHFTSPEELEQERKQEEMKKWRKKQQEDSDESSEEEESAEGSEGSEDESDSDDAKNNKKGVHDLIEIENPNRVPKKQATKLKDLESAAGSSSKAAPAPELSRREREELERQQKQANYQKLHAQGKTDQAKADLARLAIIRQQREEAAKMREQKKKEAEAKGKTSGK